MAGQMGLSDFKYPQLYGFAKDSQMEVDTGLTERNGDLGFDPSNINEFDITKFNKAFEENIERTKIQNKIAESQRLGTLQRMEDTIQEEKPYNMSVSQILIGIKDTWFYLFDDLLHSQYYVETFTKDNRLFYIGLTIIILVVLVYLFNLIFFSDNISPNANSSTQPVTVIYHVYDKNLIPINN